MRAFKLFAIVLAFGIVLLLAYRFGPLIFVLPFWQSYGAWVCLIVILLGTPLAIFTIRDLRHYVREARAEKNRCITCGYDLRAHALGSKCPECGTPISVRPSAIITQPKRSIP